MTNLDRLKGTPYLIDGLESFLRHWFAPEEPNSEPMDWSEEQQAVFEVLPDKVREIYQVAHRWPRIWNTDRGLAKIRLISPPEIARWGQTEGGYSWIEVVQLAQYQRGGRALVFLEQEDEPALQCLPGGRDLSDASALIPLSAPLEEALVSIILMSLILHGSITVNRSDETLEEATHVFSGRWFEDRPVDFYYRHQPEAKFTCDIRTASRRFIIPAYQPRVMEER